MITASDYFKVLPELLLCAFGIVVMMLDPLLDDHNDRKALGILSAIGAVCALWATTYQAKYQGIGFFNMLQVDRFSIFFHVVVLMIALATILMSF
jgi:NADH-quinone oxidoreductase subunit N